MRGFEVIDVVMLADVSTWVGDNAVTVLGWFGTLIAFAFVFGKRLSRLEDTDNHLIKTVDALSATLKELQRALEGVNGSRVSRNEQDIQAHDVRLAKMDQVLVAVEASQRRLEDKQSDIATDLKAMSHSLNRVEVQLGLLGRGKNGGGGEGG